MKRVTLDSNIYLSALVFGGKPKRILEMAIEGEIEVAVSDPIIEEVQRHLLGKFRWSEARAAEAIESIWRAERVDPGWSRRGDRSWHRKIGNVARYRLGVPRGAEVLYSEDLSDGQKYGAVRVINPLRAGARPQSVAPASDMARLTAAHRRRAERVCRRQPGFQLSRPVPRLTASGSIGESGELIRVHL